MSWTVGTGIGNRECHFAGGEVARLSACEMGRYRLDIVGLTSTHIVGSDTTLQNWGGLSYARYLAGAGP